MSTERTLYNPKMSATNSMQMTAYSHEALRIT